MKTKREHTQIDTDRTVVDFFGHLDKRVVRNLDEKFDNEEKQRFEEREEAGRRDKKGGINRKKSR